MTADPRSAPERFDALEWFDRAAAEFGRRVHLVRADQWSDATPCSEWDVHTLVNHLVNEMRWVTPLLEGRTIAEVGDRFDGDLLGDDPSAAWDDAVAEATRAIHADGALDGRVHLSYGESSAESYVAQLTSDLTLHAWDLARGIGADDTLDTDLVSRTLARIAPAADQLATSGVFGTPVEVAEGADEQTVLLGLVGRRA